VSTIGKHRGEGWTLGMAGWCQINCGCSGQGSGNGLCKFTNVVCKGFNFFHMAVEPVHGQGGHGNHHGHLSHCHHRYRAAGEHGWSIWWIVGVIKICGVSRGHVSEGR